MAKNFPYFKFIATEWLTGDIVYEDFDTQGLFINICALYWQRDGKLSIEDITKRYKNEKLIQTLSGRFFAVLNGFISISFLDEQLVDANHISKVNSENGKKGAEKRKQLATAKQPLSDRLANFSKEEKEEEEKKTNKPTIDEFIDYALENKPKANKQQLIYKYKSWENNDWCITRKDKKTPIKIWKTTLLNTLKFIDEDELANPYGLSPAQLENDRIARLSLEESIIRQAQNKELDRLDEIKRKQQNK